MASRSTFATPLRSITDRLSTRSIRLLALVLLAWLPAACGYHFPGSQVQTNAQWKNSTLQIIGQGAEQNPQLAYLLRDRLQTRLGLHGPAPGQTDGVVLKIILQPMQRTLVTEDRTGRANLFRLTLQAKPVAEGSTGLPTYPTVHGTSTYYEPFVSTSVQATQQRAEKETMEQLADTLVALLNTPF